MEITQEIAKKVIDTVQCGLVNGVGKPVPGQMCVEAAVCYAMGLPHGDEPNCVSKAIRSLKIGLNDSQWSSDKARADGLLKLSVLQLGTDTGFDDNEFVRRVAEMTIATVVPRALRHAASVHDDPKHKEALEKAAIRCEHEKSKDAARAARLCRPCRRPCRQRTKGIRCSSGKHSHRHECSRRSVAGIDWRY